MDRHDGAPRDLLLGDFGVSAQAEAVWHSLLNRPQITRPQLVDESGLNDSLLDSAIDTLTTAGLIRPAATEVGVTAIDPSVAVELHIVRAERELVQRATELAGLRARLPELASSYARGRAVAGDVPGFDVVAGLDAVRREIYLAAERATSITRAMQQGSSSATLKHAEQSDRATLARGVQVLSLIGTTTFDDPEVYAMLQIVHDLGERIRSVPRVPMRMLLIDESLAILPIDVTNTSLGAIFIRVPSVVAILVEMFDHLWAEATPAFAIDGQADAPAGRGARVLELLSLGATDERIARTLAVGVRTVRREVADIKALLGVSSRAEISAAAIRRGWL